MNVKPVLFYLFFIVLLMWLIQVNRRSTSDREGATTDNEVDNQPPEADVLNNAPGEWEDGASNCSSSSEESSHYSDIRKKRNRTSEDAAQSKSGSSVSTILVQQ